MSSYAIYMANHKKMQAMEDKLNCLLWTVLMSYCSPGLCAGWVPLFLSFLDSDGCFPVIALWIPPRPRQSEIVPTGSSPHSPMSLVSLGITYASLPKDQPPPAAAWIALCWCHMACQGHMVRYPSPTGLPRLRLRRRRLPDVLWHWRLSLWYLRHGI